MRHRFTGSGFCSRGRLDNPEHGTRIHWMTRPILRTGKPWPACRQRVSRPAGRRPDTLRSGGTTFGENEVSAACRGLLRAPGIGIENRWMRASQLAGRPSTPRTPRRTLRGAELERARFGEFGWFASRTPWILGCETRVCGRRIPCRFADCGSRLLVNSSQVLRGVALVRRHKHCCRFAGGRSLRPHIDWVLWVLMLDELKS